MRGRLDLRAILLISTLIGRCSPAAAAHKISALEGFQLAAQESAEHEREHGRRLSENHHRPQEDHDYCKGQSPPDRLVVVAAGHYDTSFLAQMGLPHVLYQHHDPSALYWYADHANEAGAYLQYIYDHYDCLSRVTAFIHGHENETWHSASMHDVLPHLRWDDENVFADINRKMPAWGVPIADLSLEPNTGVIANGSDAFNGSYSPHQIFRGRAYDAWGMGLWLHWLNFSRFYDIFLGPHGFGAAPGGVQYVCCAQFIVGAPRIRTRDRAFYQAALDYVQPDGNDLRGDHMLSRKYIVGDVWTVFWPMMFGDGPFYEPRPTCQMFQCGATNFNDTQFD